MNMRLCTILIPIVTLIIPLVLLIGLLKESKYQFLSMDNLVKKDGLPYPGYLSINAQGSEINILMGATEFLRDSQSL